MNKQLERVLNNYPRLVRERNSLEQQLAHFKGVSAHDVIDIMYSPNPLAERVQNGNILDKTAQIAMTYKERTDQINQEWHGYLEERLGRLDEEIKFFEVSIDALPTPLRAIMKDMLIDGCTWDYIEGVYNISRQTISRYKKKALAEMSEFYDLRERMLAEFQESFELHIGWDESTQKEVGDGDT